MILYIEDIYNKLLSKCPSSDRNIHYLKRYIKFIKYCRDNNNFSKYDYVEVHHICPKSPTMFPEYKSFRKFPWNKAKLSGRQHLIAHWMLSKAFGGPMHEALWSMVNGKGKYRNDLAISSKIYESARINFSNRHSKTMTEWWTPERIESRRQSYTGEGNHFFGKTHSNETKLKISHNRPNVMKGRKFDTTTCTHCGLVGGISSMKRWHFDNCKKKAA